MDMPNSIHEVLYEIKRDDLQFKIWFRGDIYVNSWNPNEIHSGLDRIIDRLKEGDHSPSDSLDQIAKDVSFFLGVNAVQVSSVDSGPTRISHIVVNNCHEYR